MIVKNIQTMVLRFQLNNQETFNSKGAKRLGAKRPGGELKKGRNVQLPNFRRLVTKHLFRRQKCPWHRYAVLKYGPMQPMLS